MKLIVPSRRMARLQLVVAAFTIFTWMTPSTCPGKILHSWNFEDPKPFHRLVIEGEPPEVINDPRNPGNHVMRALLRPGAKRPERSEVMLPNIPIGQERWVGIRVLRPDSVQNSFNCFFQLGPVDGAPGKGGGGLFQLNTYGSNIWTIRGFMERVGEQGFRKNISPIAIGRWDQFVFHIKFRDDQQGLLEVWKNGIPVFSYRGPNGFAGDRLRIKWGVYVGKGNVPKATITALFDDILIGDANSNLREVSVTSR